MVSFVLNLKKKEEKKRKTNGDLCLVMFAVFPFILVVILKSYQIYSVVCVCVGGGGVVKESQASGGGGGGEGGVRACVCVYACRAHFHPR